MTTSPAGPDHTGRHDAPSLSIPLRERRYDWFFVVAFTTFACTSLVIDTANMVGRPNPHSHNPVARLLYAQIGGADPLMMANPRFVQLSVGFVSALLFGGFYLVLSYAFVRGREWIRLPAIFGAGMVVMATGLYLAVLLLGDAPLFSLACGPDSSFDYKSPNALHSVAVNAPYPLVAVLLVARLWRSHPFTHPVRDG